MKFVKARQVVLSMGFFGALFLLGAGQTGTAPNPNKLWVVIVYFIAACALVMLLPDQALTWLTVAKRRILQNIKYLAIPVALVFVGGLIYALNLLIVFDEPNLFPASQVVTEVGLSEFLARYKSIHWLGIQHPPLVPLIDGLAMRVFGIHLIVLRVVSLVFTVGVLLVTYLIGNELYDKEAGLIALVMLPAFPYIFRLGASASNDIPVTFFFALTLWLLLRQFRVPTYWLAVATGIALGLGLLTKYTMLLIFPVLLGGILVKCFPACLNRYLVISVAVSLAIFAVWVGVAFQAGVLPVQSGRLIGYAGTVTSSGRGIRLMLEWVVARLPFAIGPYNLPLIFLGGWRLGRQRSQSDLLVLMWIMMVFMILVLTMPDTRYFLPIFPALAIVSARGISALDSPERVVGLGWLYGIGSLYLFVDWHRTVFFFY